MPGQFLRLLQSTSVYAIIECSKRPCTNTSKRVLRAIRLEYGVPEQFFGEITNGQQGEWNCSEGHSPPADSILEVEGERKRVTCQNQGSA